MYKLRKILLNCARETEHTADVSLLGAWHLP